MSDYESTPAKRTRQMEPSTEGNSPVATPRQTRYMLRSIKNGVLNGNVELPEPKRKRRLQIRKIMELNADCLLAVATSMDAKTLSNFADTCDRLRSLAKYHFRLKYGQRFDFESFSDVGRVATDRLEDAEKFLRIFGDQIVSLKITTAVFIPYRHISTELLRFIKQYCCHLKTLELLEFDMLHDSSDITSLFNCIEDLTLYDCRIADCNPGPMVNLKRLVLDGTICELWGDILWKHFPKLEDATLTLAQNLNNDSIVQFISWNPFLKRLSISQCYTVTSTIFKAVSKLGSLREFEYMFGGNPDFIDDVLQTHLNHLSPLKNLKVLKLDFKYLDSSNNFLETFITNDIGIEHLKLVRGFGDENLFENIAKLKKLKVLELIEIGYLNEKHILNFAKNLKQLEKLSINGHIILTQRDITMIIREAKQLNQLEIDLPQFILTLPIYLELLDIIQKREGDNKLELTVCGNNERVTVPDEVAKGKNEKWIVLENMPSTFIDFLM